MPNRPHNPSADRQQGLGHPLGDGRDSPWFGRVSDGSRNLTGSPRFAVVLLLAVAGWLVAGPIVDYSRAWELTATAGAPILALVLLVVGQQTQNRAGIALQRKLDEVVRATEQASDGLIGIEDSAGNELNRLLGDYGDHGRIAAGTVAGPKGLERRRRQRHAQSDLGPDRSFVFRSQGGTVDVIAPDLVRFVRLAQTVDDATWLHHLRVGDYSRWFREALGDGDLAAIVAPMEGSDDATSAESRRRVVAAIGRRYAIAG